MSVFTNDEGIFLMPAEKARRNRQEALGYLENDYKSIAAILGRYYPPAILSKAAWQSWQLSTARRQDDFQLAVARILPVLLQSVFISRYFDNSSGYSSNQDIRDRDWDRLRSLVDDACRRFLRLIDCHAVIALDEGLIDRASFFDYRQALFDQLFGRPLTEKTIDDTRSLFLDLLSGDEDLCQEIFRTDAGNLMAELYKIARSCATSIADLVAQTGQVNEEIRAKVDALMAQKPQITRQIAVDEVVAKGGYKPVLERLAARGNSYDMFCVEYESLLSGSSLRPLSAEAAGCDEVLICGRLSAAVHPLVRFADRYYTFLGPMFYQTVVLALADIFRKSPSAGDRGAKLEKLFNKYILFLFREDDVQNVYWYKGYKADVILLSSLGYINAWRYPEAWMTRRSRRKTEEATRPQLGHALIFVDPDRTGSASQEADGHWLVPLPDLADMCAHDGRWQSFLNAVFSLDDGEDREEDGIFDEALSDYDEGTAETVQELDDVPPQVLIDDEGEYDWADDDEKARQIESRFDQEEALPDDALPQAPPVDIDSYEIPEELRNEPLREELEDLDDDEFTDDEVPDVEDEEDEESFLLDDEDELDDEDDFTGFEDDDIAPESTLVEDEEYAEGADIPDGECYVPGDDPDQLVLFDEDGEPAVDPETDELAQLDSLEEDTSDLAGEDGAAPETDEDLTEPDPASVQDAPQPEEDSEDDVASQELGEGDDEEAEAILADPALAENEERLLDDGGSDELVSASEEEEADEEEEPPVSIADDDEGDYDPVRAESEEALLDSAPSEESQEAGQEEDELAGELSAGTDDDLMEDQSAPYGSEVSFTDADRDSALSSQAADTQTRIVSLPAQLAVAASRLSQNLPELAGFLSSLDRQTLDSLDSALGRSITACRSEGRDKLLVIPSARLSFTISASDRLDALRRMEIRNAAGSQMYARGCDGWTFALLIYDEKERLVRAWGGSVDRDSFGASDWKIVRVLGEELRRSLG